MICNRAGDWDRWVDVATKGDHRQFKHPALPGRVTVPHPEWYEAWTVKLGDKLYLAPEDRAQIW